MFMTPSCTPIVRHLIERYLGMIRGVQQQSAKRLDVAALLFAQPHHYSETLFALPHLRGGPAAERCLDHILDVGDIDAVSCGPCTVDLHLQLRHPARAINKGAADAANGRDELQQLGRSSF